MLIIPGVEHSNPSVNQREVLNHLIAAQTFITLATTVTSTLLIAYRLYTVSKQEIRQNSRTLIQHIIEIVVHSAAAYSLAAAAQAIILIIPAT